VGLAGTGLDGLCTVLVAAARLALAAPAINIVPTAAAVLRIDLQVPVPPAQTTAVLTSTVLAVLAYRQVLAQLAALALVASTGLAVLTLPAALAKPVVLVRPATTVLVVPTPLEDPAPNVVLAPLATTALAALVVAPGLAPSVPLVAVASTAQAAATSLRVPVPRAVPVLLGSIEFRVAQRGPIQVGDPARTVRLVRQTSTETVAQVLTRVPVLPAAPALMVNTETSAPAPAADVAVPALVAVQASTARDVVDLSAMFGSPRPSTTGCPSPGWECTLRMVRTWLSTSQPLPAETTVTAGGASPANLSRLQK